MLGTAEVAEIGGVSQRRVVAMIQAGIIKAKKGPGGAYLIDPKSLRGVRFHGKAGRPPKQAVA